MILDALQLDDGTCFDADFTVAGAGPAGISLALQLARNGARVTLLESGGIEEDPMTRSLYEGRNLGLPYHQLSACRVRALGGTSHKWAGFLKPQEARDFDPVPGLPLASWPVSFDELSPFLEAAAEFLSIDPNAFDVQHQFQNAGWELPSGSSPDVRVFHRLPETTRNFRDAFARELESTENLQVVLHANVVGFRTLIGRKKVEALEIRTLNGRSMVARSAFHVLACHGIENARLLLDCGRDDRPVGSGSPLLGRCFMDHPTLIAGELRVKHLERLPRFLVLGEGKDVSACVTADQRTTDAAGCLQYFCRLVPSWKWSAGGVAMKQVFQGLRRPGRNLIRAMTRAAKDIRGAKEYLNVRRRQPPAAYLLNHRIEQAPNPDSRVVLSRQRDRLGNRRADLDWRLSDVDVKSFQVGQAIVVDWLRSLNIGRVCAPVLSQDEIRRQVTTYWHHMGTTRMGQNEDDSVVDRNCRVHGTENLFVAGSSVFCRGTLSPPTFLIVALALRLSEHLQSTKAA